MYIYTYIHIYICMYKYLNICTYTYACVHIHTCIYGYLYVCRMCLYVCRMSCMCARHDVQQSCMCARHDHVCVQDTMRSSALVTPAHTDMRIYMQPPRPRRQSLCVEHLFCLCVTCHTCVRCAVKERRLWC